MRRAIQIDQTFPHSYEVEELHELPGNGKFDVPVLYFPRPTGTRPDHDGIWLKIRAANGKSWVGVFAFGYSEPPAISRIVSTADPDRVCVISRGAAYVVSADNPGSWEEIPAIPVLDVRSIPARQLLLFADFTRLAAYGNNGLVWRSPQVCWDELKIVNITQDIIDGVGYDPTNKLRELRRFVVDIETGRSLLPSPVSIDGKPLWKQ